MWSTKIIVIRDDATNFDEVRLKEILEKYQRMLEEALSTVTLP